MLLCIRVSTCLPAVAVRLAPRDAATPAQLHRNIVEERRDPMTKLKQIRAKLRGEMSASKKNISLSSRIEEDEEEFYDAQTPPKDMEQEDEQERAYFEN